MIIGLVPFVRDSVITAITSLSDCDVIIVKKGTDGELPARNALIEAAPEDSFIRFCDDDDIAFNTRLMAGAIGDADVIAASYRVRNRVVSIPNDPLLAAVNFVGPWNWVARRRSLDRIFAQFGSYFDPIWKMNSGTRFWLRMIDTGLRFTFLPDIFCYQWNRGTPGSISSGAKIDTALYQELLDRGAPKNLVMARRRFDMKSKPYKEVG